MQSNNIEYNIRFGSTSDHTFEKYRDVKNTINKILKNKTVCLSCNSIFLEKTSSCSHCGAKTTRIIDSEIFKNLINSKIKALRYGIPGDRKQTRHDCVRGGIKTDMDNLKLVAYIEGFNPDDNFFTTYQFPIWDLERLMLISFHLWNLLYNQDLGTFVWKERVFDGHIRIPKELMDYINRDNLFLFTGNHKNSNKKVLILSQENNPKIPYLSDVKYLDKKIKAKAGLMDLNPFLIKDFEFAEWHLFFYKDDMFFVVPQNKPLFDVRFDQDLAKLVELDIISKDYNLKPSLRMWDMEDS